MRSFVTLESSGRVREVANLFETAPAPQGSKLQNCHRGRGRGRRGDLACGPSPGARLLRLFAVMRPRPSRGIPAALLAAWASLVSAAPQGGLAGSSRADYRIHARLDGETKKIDGELELRWTNRSGASVRDLWFHLYL